LNPDQEEKLSRSPTDLIAMIEALDNKKTWFFIDEIQKVPKLLDVVHLCIEKFKTPFALTGSSARKLKRGAANLLAGRAFVFNMFPLTHLELKDSFDLQECLQWGSLPQIYHYSTPLSKIRYLRTYGQVYVKEEIVAEQLVRKLNPFRQFLEIAAQANGEIINYSNIARDVNVDTVTVQSYFQILEDTLVGYLLPSYHLSIRKRQRHNPKFYFFDLGVKRSLENLLSIELKKNTYAYGRSFEHFIIMEIVRLNHYFETHFKLSYLRTKDKAEIDLIIERPGNTTVLIEIKSKDHVDERDTKSLVRFQPEFDNALAMLLSNDAITKKISGVIAYHWNDGISWLFK
jgi:predicted AAA+ superfamily ATPase